MDEQKASRAKAKSTQVKVEEILDTPETSNQREWFKKFVVRGPDSPWDAMNTDGVPETGMVYDPKHPHMIAGMRSARPISNGGDPDDCDEWEVTIRYVNREEIENRHRQQRAR